jgi:uncharacterized protein (DUF305 family)
MKNNNQSILYGIIGLFLGVVLTTYVAANSVNNNNVGMMQMMGMNSRSMAQHMSEVDMDEMMGHGNNDMGMDEMVDELSDLEGDEFDKSFITLMIEHHQGAIDMANLVNQNAKHDEIKNLADDIISAQTSEINMMKRWLNEWSYE